MNSKGTNELDLVVSNTQIATQSQTKTYVSKGTGRLNLLGRKHTNESSTLTFNNLYCIADHSLIGQKSAWLATYLVGYPRNSHQADK